MTVIEFFLTTLLKETWCLQRLPHLGIYNQDLEACIFENYGVPLALAVLILLPKYK